MDHKMMKSEEGGIQDPKTMASATINLTVTEAAEMLRLSRAMIYRLIEREGLPTVRFGRAVRIPLASLQEWQAHRIQNNTQ